MDNKCDHFSKRSRLPDFEYKGEFSCSVTICTSERKDVFLDGSFGNKVLEVLKECSERFSFLVHAYCFMPDHIHLLLQGDNAGSDLKRFVSAFKQKCGFEYSKINKAKLWQTSYYDHVLRKEEAVRDVALYILNNPVRKGLVDVYYEYPLSGSFTFDIKEM